MSTDMKIRPFKEYQDNLFTDYAMQIFNAHTSENSQENLSMLIDTYQDDATSNPAFLPGVVFGSMIHMFMMIRLLAEEKGISIDEMVHEYTDFYNSNRKKLSKMLGNRPEYADEMVRKFIEDLDK